MSQALTSRPTVDFTAAALTPAVDDALVRDLASKIDVSSAMSISQFGQEIGSAAASYTDELLSQARTEDLDELGSKLAEIMAAAQSFDLKSFDGGLARLPLVGPLVRRFALTKEKVMGRFRSVEGQIDNLMGNVDGALRRLSERSNSLEVMYEGVAKEHVLLATHVRAGELRAGELEHEIACLGAQTSDLAVLETREKLESGLHTLRKRIGDLSVLQHSALQTLPMIRMMQTNNIVLLEKFQTIQKLTLPAWKRTFVMALALNEQKDAVKLADEIDDATNYFMKRNSELLHDNALATARSSQRLVIDVETLRAVHDNVLKTLADVHTVYQDGAAKRTRAIAELSELRAEMSGRGRFVEAGGA